ncbi:MAG TPA: hypothetical protein VF614_18490, partial [Chthoniobacteraceae bacterium]
PARDREERLLRDLIGHAKRIYLPAARDASLFVMRTVFGVSGECDFTDDPCLPVNGNEPIAKFLSEARKKR